MFQKRLGDLHDVDVAIEVITNEKRLSVAARQQVLASLATLRNKRVHKYLRELDPLGADERPKTEAARPSRADVTPGSERQPKRPTRTERRAPRAVRSTHAHVD